MGGLFSSILKAVDSIGNNLFLGAAQLWYVPFVFYQTPT
jgi:hypothetical protein